ncbi:MAG: hypothetical protein HXX81_02050, partial [Campylobacterales bacterium]|nr:hypothetical protein [Campylobacterales bacterium]
KKIITKTINVIESLQGDGSVSDVDTTDYNGTNLNYFQTLRNGWNLVKAPTNSLISMEDLVNFYDKNIIIETNETNFTAYTNIYGYLNNKWYSKNDKDGYFSYQDGIWVYLDINIDSHAIDLSELTPLVYANISLTNGWNLKSNPLSSKIYVRNLLQSEIKNCEYQKLDFKIFRYINSQWKYYDSSYNGDDMIGSYEGFWIYSDTSKNYNITAE